MPDINDLTTKGQDLVAKAVDTADTVVGAMKDVVREKAPALGGVADLVPDPSEVVGQVTATANELLTLAQDVQNKVISALTSNA